jgi:hypothetical protein
MMWTGYVVALPLAAVHMLRSLDRDRWGVLLVFPLIMSYWVTGGFFAFATAAPLVVLGLSVGVRWLRTSTPRQAVTFALIACCVHLWHALAYAQLVFCFCGLWCLCRFDDLRSRAAALGPLLPSMALFAAWLGVGLLRRAPGGRAPTWAPFFENARHILDPLAPLVPGSAGATVIFVVLLVACAFGFGVRVRRVSAPFRVATPFGWVALALGCSYFVLPSSCFGVEGIGNRQPWVAALLMVFAFPLPERRVARALVLGWVGVASAAILIFLGRRFAAFDAETIGAYRLLDQLKPRETLLVYVGDGATESFPAPAKPLVALAHYATARHGGLPDSSFAGYDTNIVRYANGRNPMPGLNYGWRARPRDLARFDYLLARGGDKRALPEGLRLVASDAGWSLFAICAGRAGPHCP